MKRILCLIFLVAVSLSVSVNAPARKVRVLYWNIQNGMWAGQADDYKQFVKFVKGKKPDICVWCEAKTLYETGTNRRVASSRQYLPDNWEELAARYGHKYVFLAMHRDNYPQVITSRRPIRPCAKIGGSEPDSVVAHGAGWAQVDFGKQTLNVVCVHTYPQRFRYGIPKTDKAERARSAAAHEGDAYRAMEVKYICDHSIKTHPDAAHELWLMCGDFNSIARADNHFYKQPEDSPLFQCQDYIQKHTPYIDVIARLNPGRYITSNRGTRRCDYVFCTQALMDRLVRAFIVNEDWAVPRKAQGVNFFIPSDHRPIYAEFDLK